MSLLTLQEAATQLRMHPETLRTLCRNHRIQHLQSRPYAAYRFKPEHLEAYIEGLTKAPETTKKPPKPNNRGAGKRHGFDQGDFN